MHHMTNDLDKEKCGFCNTGLQTSAGIRPRSVLTFRFKWNPVLALPPRGDHTTQLMKSARAVPRVGRQLCTPGCADRDRRQLPCQASAHVHLAAARLCTGPTAEVSNRALPSRRARRTGCRSTVVRRLHNTFWGTA